MTLDCRGRRCPLPILDLARHIGDVVVGETVTVEADDPAAGPDVTGRARLDLVTCGQREVSETWQT